MNRIEQETLARSRQARCSEQALGVSPRVLAYFTLFSLLLLLGACSFAGGAQAHAGLSTQGNRSFGGRALVGTAFQGGPTTRTGPPTNLWGVGVGAGGELIQAGNQTFLAAEGALVGSVDRRMEPWSLGAMLFVGIKGGRNDDVGQRVMFFTRLQFGVEREFGVTSSFKELAYSGKPEQFFARKATGLLFGIELLPSNFQGKPEVFFTIGGSWRYQQAVATRAKPSP